MGGVGQMGGQQSWDMGISLSREGMGGPGAGGGCEVVREEGRGDGLEAG